jgi:hypothetical protein
MNKIKNIIKSNVVHGQSHIKMKKHLHCLRLECRIMYSIIEVKILSDKASQILRFGFQSLYTYDTSSIIYFLLNQNLKIK